MIDPGTQTRAYEIGREAWPGLPLPQPEFIAFVRSRLPDDAPDSALLSLRLDDLYLVCAALSGVPGAVEAFRGQIHAAVQGALFRLKLSASQRSEAVQLLETQLLVAEAPASPQLAGYSGRGRLLGWVAVVASRTAMAMLTKTKREVLIDRDLMEGVFDDRTSPELGYLKRVYHQEFKIAFRAALEALERADRLLLKQRYFDEVPVNALAAMHKTHRATVSRWLAAAREKLAEATHRRLAAQLDISPTECRSAINLIQSQLDVTMSALAAANSDEDES